MMLARPPTATTALSQERTTPRGKPHSRGNSHGAPRRPMTFRWPEVWGDGPTPGPGTHTGRRKKRCQRLCSNCASKTPLSLPTPGSRRSPPAASCSLHVFQELFGLSKRCCMGRPEPAPAPIAIPRQTAAPADGLATGALGAYLQLLEAIAEGRHLVVPVAAHQLT